MNAWELFVQDFHTTQWPFWFLYVALIGYGLGWKACCWLKFNDIKLQMHERRILNQIEEAQRLGKWPFDDPSPNNPARPHDAFYLAAVAVELGVGIQEARDGSWRKRFEVVDA